MSQRYRFVASLLVLVVLLLAMAHFLFTRITRKTQDGFARLQWKFEKGKTFYQELTTETKQTMKVMQMDITQDQKLTFYVSWTPVAQDEKTKAWTIKQKIEGIKMDIDIGGNKVTFDSTKDTGAANPLDDYFKALIGFEFTVTVSPDFEVLNIVGREEFMQKLSKAGHSDVVADAILPDLEVKPEGRWSKSGKLNLGPIGIYKTNNEYRLESVDDNALSKISIKGSISYQKPDDEARQPFKIARADIDNDIVATGEILFDTVKGRIVSSNINFKLQGKLTIHIAGDATEVDVLQIQKTTSKTTDENPLKSSP